MTSSFYLTLRKDFMAKNLRMNLLVAGVFAVVDPVNLRRFEPGQENTKVEVTSWVVSQYAHGTFTDAPEAADENAAALAAFDDTQEAEAEVALPVKTVIKPGVKPGDPKP